MKKTKFTDLAISNTMSVADIFDEYGLLPNLRNLYIARFGKLPNQIEISSINCKKAHEWFIKNYQSEITDSCFSRRYCGSKKEDIVEKICYFLFDDLLISLNKYANWDDITILYQKTDNILIDTLVNELRKFKGKNCKKYVELLVSDSDGLNTRRMKISKPRFSIEENYNDDFLPIHQTILSRLRKKNDKGLVLLHGKPGTGKTSYIRHLITKTPKSVIFLPPNMAASITDPGLMN